MDFPNLSGRVVKTIVAFPHPLFHPPDLRSLKRPVNSLQGTVADPGDDPPPPPLPQVWIWHWSRHLFNKSVTQSYIDHSRHHESKWNKIIFWLAPTLCQFQCSNCLYCKIRLLCRLTYKGIVCHPFSPLNRLSAFDVCFKRICKLVFCCLIVQTPPTFFKLKLHPLLKIFSN